MNIDERLEALTHSVELLATMHKDGEKRMQRLEGLVPRLRKERRDCFMPSKLTNSASAIWKETKLSSK
jgi:hypothetical protein